MTRERANLAGDDRGMVTAEPAAPPKPTAPAAPPAAELAEAPAPPAVELADLDRGDPGRLLEIARALGFDMTREQAEAEIQAARGRPGAVGEADAIMAAAEANGIPPAELRRQARRFQERSSEIGLELTIAEAAFAVANRLPGIFIFDDFVRARGGDLGAAAAAFSELAERLGAAIDLGATVDRLAILDPKELGKRAAAFADAKGRATGSYVTIESALEAVRADPRAHERAERALAERRRAGAGAAAGGPRGRLSGAAPRDLDRRGGGRGPRQRGSPHRRQLRRARGSQRPSSRRARRAVLPTRPGAARCARVHGRGSQPRQAAAERAVSGTPAAALAERERQLQRQESEAFVDGLLRAGRLAPGHKRAAVELMDQFDGEAPVEGERSPLEDFKAFLGSLPRAVH